MYKRPSAKPSRAPRAQNQAPYVPVNRGPPPSWVTNRKYTASRGNNRWTTYIHDNRRTGLRTTVRVAPGETLANTWRMNGFPDPTPMPGRFAMLEEGEILTRTLPMPRTRTPVPPPRMLTPFPPPPPSVNNTQNKMNRAYIKGIVTRIIHKLINKNEEDKKYISRLVGGIISKIKRANPNTPRSVGKNNATGRKRTSAGGIMAELVRNKAAKKAYANKEGITLAQVNALIRTGLVNSNNLNNALRALHAERRQVQRPVNLPTGNLPALRTYEEPARAPGLQSIELTNGSPNRTGPVVQRASKAPVNRARALQSNLSERYLVAPVSTAVPAKKKNTGVKSRLAKKLKKF